MFIILTACWAGPATAVEYVTVPQLLNHKVNDAKATAERIGLEVEVRRDRVVTDPRFFDLVYKQAPKAASALPPGGKLVLYVNKYPGEASQLTRVPNVINQSLPQARQTLKKAEMGEVVVDYWTGNEEVYDNNVVMQEPMCGRMVLKGTRSGLLVYRYDPNMPKKVLLPNITGKPVDQATKTLTDMGLKVKIHPSMRSTHDKDKDGLVASQSPPPKAQILTGKQAVLYVYKYMPPPPMVEVPDVTGKTLKEAQAMLAKVGLRSHARTPRSPFGGQPSPDFTVQSQAPPAGEKVPQNRMVTLILKDNSAQLPPGLSPEKWTYAPGSDIRVSYFSPRGASKSCRIDLVLSSEPHGKPVAGPQRPVASKTMLGQGRGSLTFKAPDRPGSYDLRMYYPDAGGREVASVTLQVK